MGHKSTVIGTVVATRKQHIHLLLSPALAMQIRELAERGRRPLSTQIEMLLERALSEPAA